MKAGKQRESGDVVLTVVPGHWEYAVRTYDEDGDVDQIDDGSSWYAPRAIWREPEHAKEDSHLWPEGELIRRWVPDPSEWEVVDG